MIGTGAAIALAVSAGASTAGTIYASNRQASANRDALRAQTRSNDQALAVEREERDYDRGIDAERYAREQARLDRIERLDSETRARNEARSTRDENFERTQWNANAEYRATGKAALGELASLAGLEVGDVAGEHVAMVPDAPPSEIPAQTVMPTTSRRRVGDLVPGVTPQAAPEDPAAAGEDGLVEVRLPRDEYERLSTQWMPQRPNRRPVSRFLAGGV
jgi:hypothetical protein